jgi:hypothetical protein
MRVRHVRTSSDLADGLVAVAESFLAGKVAGADDAEVYQVVVHAGADVLAQPAAAGVSAETPAAPARVSRYTRRSRWRAVQDYWRKGRNRGGGR